MTKQEFIKKVIATGILDPAVDDYGMEHITSGRAFEEVCHILELDDWQDGEYLDCDERKVLKRLKNTGVKMGLQRIMYDVPSENQDKKVWFAEIVRNFGE